MLIASSINKWLNAYFSFNKKFKQISGYLKSLCFKKKKKKKGLVTDVENYGWQAQRETLLRHN